MSRNGEFQIIDRFFTHDAFGEWQSQGVGDDCAIIDTGAGRIAVTTDMMAVGTHFLPTARPEDIGWKALAVNLSDLAAAGASPRAFFLSIGLPERDDAWLEGFSRGLMTLAAETGCALLGGDTTRTADVNGTRAPVTISITAMGALPKGKGLMRKGARPGDDIWVSGTVGDAYAALKHRWGHWQLMPDAAESLFARMDRPTPRISLGSALLDLATACADISDGLRADLGHILERSGVGADLRWEAVPLSPALRSLSVQAQQEAALSGGDDYELVFTAPESARLRIEQAGLLTDTRLTRIGKVTEGITGDNLTVRTESGAVVSTAVGGFDHFAG
ncbi:MAG: thiamine-phosphate kinase [Sutterella sp.]|nr:thiamine-phosphate kinase [Sutterella sp.]